MFRSSGGLCLYFTFTLTVLCNELYGQRLEILPNQPEQTKAIGKAVMLTCRANVTDPNQVSPLEWRNNKGKVVERLMFGVQNQTMYTETHPDGGLILFISKLDQSMSGEYTCTANLGGTEPLKTSVVLKTIFPITWIDAPLHQYPVINKDYKIRCHVQADPAASIDWLKNGETISTFDRYVIESTGLLIRNVQESDDGIYACRAAVIFTGDLDIRYIKVEVQIPPKIDPMAPIEIVEGEQATIQCKATGKPPPRYSWIKGSNKQNLSRSGRFSVNENTGLLTINKIEQDDHSEYKCVATNTAGDIETTVNVIVLFKPKIYEFANITAPENKETKLICKASGRPLPQILFRRYGSRENFIIGPQTSNSDIILSQENHETKGETFGILGFIKLKRSDDGLYECIAKNKAGEMRKNGHVTTEFAPNFESSKNQLPVWTWNKKPGNLSCIAESIPNATIEWRYNDRQIINDNDNRFRIINKGPQSFLIVNHNDNSDLFKKYKCIATNKLGRAEHFVELKRATVPQPIQQVKVLSLTATTILFDIVGPAILDGLPVRAFIAQYREERVIDWNSSNNKTWSVESPYILENLEPEMTYKFRFAAYNDVGLGGWDSPQTHTMSRRSAPNEPRILSSPEEGVVSSPYADHFDLRWKIPADNGEPIDNYQIKFCAVRRVSGEWIVTPDACNTEELSGGEQPEMRIGELVSDTHYKIELRAHNAIGYSSPAELIVKTARGLDTMVYKSDDPTISSATIIGIVVAAVLLILILVDLMCYCCNRAGILMAICERTRKMPPDEEDAKLGSYKAASAHPNTLAVPLPVKLATTPVEEKEPLKQGDRNSVVNDTMKKSLSVEYDGTRVQARTGEIIGKNSAV